MFIAKYIRTIFYIITGVIISGAFIYSKTAISSISLQTIRLTQIYGISSTIFLYFALLCSPLYIAFPSLPGMSVWKRARRALGVSAWVLALLHAYNAFFVQLGGFEGFAFLGSNYILPIILSTIALVIFSLMAITSFDFVIKLMGKNWKRLHRLVYIAGFLVVIHALMLGTHFSNLSEAIPLLFTSALIFLLILELYRFDRYIRKIIPVIPSYSLLMIGCLAIFSFYIVKAQPYLKGEKSLSIHGAHNNASTDSTSHGIMDSDTKDNFIVIPSVRNSINPNVEVTIPFMIHNEKTDEPVSLFKIQYEKIMHAIVVDSTLTHYQHLHPDQVGSEFHLITKFPGSGTYFVYLNFEPLGFAEQVSQFSLNVGNTTDILPSNHKPDLNLSKTIGRYRVNLSIPSDLNSDQLSLGRQSLSLTVNEASTNLPITDLQPYLGAFGHMAMINQQTYDYMHIHPTSMNAIEPNQLAGPSIEFTPMLLDNSTIRPGIYRIFVQFKHNEVVQLADFTVEVK